VVQCLDLVQGRAGDGVDGRRLDLAGPAVGAAALDLDGLDDVGKNRPGWTVQTFRRRTSPERQAALYGELRRLGTAAELAGDSRLRRDQIRPVYLTISSRLV
jgi:hypothetical protein